MKLRIFIADVDDVLADLLNASLQESDIELRSVDRGSLALMELKDFPPHVALLNCNLRGISGYDLCEIIKQDKDLSAARVVLIDSEDEPLDAGRADSVGYDAHLRRPYNVDSITALLEGLGVDGFGGSGQTADEKEFFDLEAASESVESLPDVFELDGDGDKDELLDKTPEPVALEELDADESMDAEAAESVTTFESPPREADHKRTLTVEEVLSSQTGKRLVKEIVSQMSDEVVRDVAWQVVPELAEEIIEQTLEKLKNKKD